MNYQKTARPEKIIQFGEGGFLRGFVDWIVQIANEKTDFNGSVVVVQPIAQGMCDMLQAQDCVYTHVMRGLKDGEPTVDKKIIDCISRTVKPYDDYKAYLELADNPDFKIIVSNTTESGISYCDSDTLESAPHTSFPAKVTALLYRRFKNGMDGFLFLPCELIEKNGETLKSIVIRYATEWNLEKEFVDWVENKNTFCNTLVDRIVTGYPKDEDMNLGYEDNMVNTSELFHLWVIEGNKDAVLSTIALDKTGLNIVLTDDLPRYRTRKVRILNGAHTSMIPYAMLCGVETVKDCMEDETVSAFVNKCVFDEIVPTLDLPEEELIQYANDVFERFNNPFIRHYCASISLNSVSKFKVRVLPSLLEYIKRYGKKPENLMMSFAYLIKFYKDGTPTDDADVIDFMKSENIPAILSNKDFWGEDLSYLADDLQKYYNSINI
ncbi:MAG: tagaturonate reductase [Clostridia bacterium]|nr:tagaturonate reductase [Clostridia bacterium]